MPQPSSAIRTVRFDRIDSTSLEARRRLSSGEIPAEPVLLVADVQTGGKGRRGRSWESPEGGLWCSLLAPIAPDSLEGLGLRVGVAMTLAINSELEALGSAIRATLKWPNDALLGRAKAAGALTEILRTRGAAHAIVGVGINANNTPPTLAEPARHPPTSIREACGRPCDLRRLEASLATLLLDALAPPGLSARDVARARQLLHGVGEPIQTRSPSIRGTLVGIDDLGRAIIRTPEGVEALASADEIIHPDASDESGGAA